MPQLRVCSSVMGTRPAPLATDSAVWCGDVAFRRRHDGGYTLAASAGSRFDIVPDALQYFSLFAPARRLNRGEVRLRFGAAFFRALATPKRWKPDAVTPFERTRVLDPAPDRALLARALRDARALLPQFAQLEMAESWAGMIDVMPDSLPVVSAIDGLDGFYLATGFSGHGFGMGPATGLLMAELITKGAARVDLAPFRFSRFLDGTPMEPFKPRSVIPGTWGRAHRTA
ncbi:MAG: FAD-binding oxidoreductase [Alphaproteobacteria bacterium]|nr:FAD-binding oxidoreductase [Alphaproteobacteria bacterium]